MRKHFHVMLATIFLAGISAGEDSLPLDITSLIDQRSAAVAKIDKVYVDQLQKLKIEYAKRGDLNMAITVSSLIEKVQENKTKDLLNAGKWRYQLEKEDVLVRTFSGDSLVTETGNRHPFVISKNVIRIDWGGGAYEEMTFDPDKPDELKGVNYTGAKLKYFR